MTADVASGRTYLPDEIEPSLEYLTTHAARNVSFLFLNYSFFESGISAMF